jgi:hypothetical protein
MKNLILSCLTTLAVAKGVLGQDDVVPSASLTVAATTVSPAATLFPVEMVQLTDEVLTNVSESIQNETISNMFLFGSNSTESLSKRGRLSCKAMPGDWFWPSWLIWEIFDILLGRRLIEPTPLAAYCYPDRSEYDAVKCASISAGWLTSDVQ